MKKIFMMVVAAIMVSAPTAMAQKINVESIKAKAEKSDAAIENPKKSAKAATWLSRGDVYYEALNAPVSNLYISMSATELKLLCGEKKAGSEAIDGTTYTTYSYPYFTAFVKDDKVVGWKVKKSVVKNAYNVAYKAYAKAYELDPKVAAKAKAGMEQLSNYKAQIGDISNTLQDYKTGAKAYVDVYDIQSHPAYNIADPVMLYYAGYMYTIAAATDAALYKDGVKALNRAIKAGYVEVEAANTEMDDKEKGNIFYYLYHCYYGQKEADQANVLKAKEALVKGVETFPKNQKILDALTQLYTTEKDMGDPQDLIAMIDAAIALDPQKPDLWFARGRVFFSLRDFDNSIESFAKVTELAPQVFDGHFYLAMFYIYKADAMNDVISNKTYTENAEYGKDLKEANAVYAAALPILERAYELKPTDLPTVEYLKSLCFRLRDEDGVMEKYTKYNDLFKEMQAKQ